MTKILVVKEKHGNRYFDITAEGQLGRVALFLLQQRLDEGWYPEPCEPEAPDFTADDIPGMPEALKKGAAILFEQYQQELLTYRQERAEYNQIQKALAEKNLRMAASALLSRSDYEYEDVQVVECEEPK